MAAHPAATPSARSRSLARTSPCPVALAMSLKARINLKLTVKSATAKCLIYLKAVSSRPSMLIYGTTSRSTCGGA
jgi:hypothetical protein